MGRKAFNSLNEAALQVQLNEAKKKVKTKSGSTEHVSDDDLKAAGGVFDRIRKGGEKRNPVNIVTDPQLRLGLGKGEPAGGKVKSESVELALEYFENYFGGTLNESTSDEDIMEAVYDLVDLCESVCEEVGLDEDFKDAVEKIKQIGKNAYTWAGNRERAAREAMFHKGIAKEYKKAKNDPPGKWGKDSREWVEKKKEMIKKMRSDKKPGKKGNAAAQSNIAKQIKSAADNSDWARAREKEQANAPELAKKYKRKSEKYRKFFWTGGR